MTPTPDHLDRALIYLSICVVVCLITLTGTLVGSVL